MSHLLDSVADSSSYAHYVFSTFDQDHDGAVSFEVSVSVMSLPFL